MGFQKDMLTKYIKQTDKIETGYVTIPDYVLEIFPNTFNIETDVDYITAKKNLDELLGKHTVQEILKQQHNLFTLEKYVRSIETRESIRIVTYEDSHVIIVKNQHYYNNTRKIKAIFGFCNEQNTLEVIESDYHITFIRNNRYLENMPETAEDIELSTELFKKELREYSTLLLYETLINDKDPILKQTIIESLEEIKFNSIEKENYEEVIKIKKFLESLGQKPKKYK